jgi:hypothetical protein
MIILLSTFAFSFNLRPYTEEEEDVPEVLPIGGSGDDDYVPVIPPSGTVVVDRTTGEELVLVEVRPSTTQISWGGRRECRFS